MDANKKLPSADGCIQTATRHLSWRDDLATYIESQLSIRSSNQDEPGDSEHNRRAYDLAHVPEGFISACVRAARHSRQFQTVY